MKQISELPFRQRLTLGILYLVALGLIMAANVIALLAGFIAGYAIGLVVQFILLMHLIRRA